MHIPTILAALLISQVSVPAIGVPHKPLPGSGPIDPMAWTRLPWNGDDTPYAAIRSKLEETKLTPALVGDYQKEADGNLNDPIAQFRWVYAYHEAYDQGIIPQTSRIGPGALLRGPVPHCYNYLRLLFLVMQPVPNGDPTLREFGYRLLAQQPHDFDVEYRLEDFMDPWQSPSQRKEAIDLAMDQYKQHPDKPGVYAIVGGVYFVCWLVHGEKNDGLTAIKWYRDYLNRAPKDSAWIAFAQKRINDVQQHLNHPYTSQSRN